MSLSLSHTPVIDFGVEEDITEREIHCASRGISNDDDVCPHE